jgi:hypothetical protein
VLEVSSKHKGCTLHAGFPRFSQGKKMNSFKMGLEAHSVQNRRHVAYGGPAHVTPCVGDGDGGGLGLATAISGAGGSDAP